jgi:hypothetical protein
MFEIIIKEKNIKKPLKLLVVCNIALQYSKGNKITTQTTKMYKKKEGC